MFYLPDDDYEPTIQHTMLKSDLNQLIDSSKDKKNLQYTTDSQKRSRKWQ